MKSISCRRDWIDSYDNAHKTICPIWIFMLNKNIMSDFEREIVLDSTIIQKGHWMDLKMEGSSSMLRNFKHGNFRT